MPLATAVGVAVLLLAVLVAGTTVITYNAVVSMRRRLEATWANIDVALKQRWDTLPNLVVAVRGTLGFERQVLDEVARLRAAYTPTAPLAHQAAVATATTAAVRSLFAVVEAYPELRSQENVRALQEEIERLETVIAQRRELFNAQVLRYNTAISQLPAVLLAGVLGWRPVPFFDIDPGERVRPEARVLEA